MCGIIGYTGLEDCVPFLLEGLTDLEYRGYDSAGIAVQEGGQITVRKESGPISNLKERVEAVPVHGTCGIGHTRWATHGAPSRSNSHPHLDQKGRVAVVHNGVIENYQALRRELEAEGVVFASETDTEVVAQLLGQVYDGDLLAALRLVLPRLEGSFALGVLGAGQPGAIYCTRRQSPLLIGLGEHAAYLSSDGAALLAHTRTMCTLEDDEIAVLTPEGVVCYNRNGKEIEKRPFQVEWDQNAARKNGFDHFMLKEIYEQPKAVRDTLEHYADLKTGTLRQENMPLSAKEAQGITEITIVACGTAYHAGMMGQAFLEKIAGIRTNVSIASEYRYGNRSCRPGELLIAVSQSGETADTLAAVRRENARGTRTVALSNVIGSTIAREADHVMYTLAGPEIAVASTKAYLTQVLSFLLLSLDLAYLRGTIGAEMVKKTLDRFARLPGEIEQVLARRDQVKAFAKANEDCHDVFFIGRLMDYTTSLEAALKLKEISYLHSEAYAAGELKHGTIALIDETTLVVAFATQEAVLSKTYTNMEEVKARGARLLLIGVPGERQEWEVWPIPEGTSELEAPLVATVYAQLFAYETALLRGCSIDKPRNLAKSVTVE